MEIRCSPYNPVVFCVFIGILIFCNHSSASGQCKGDFTYESTSTQDEEPPSGKIVISLKDKNPGIYTFKLYKMAGVITFVQSKEASSPDKIIFEDLIPANYFVKIEWGESCSKILGGIEGIIITAKDPGR